MVKDEEREAILRILESGSARAVIGNGRRATHARAIWSLLEEAITALDAEPDREREWLKSETRSRGWASAGLTKTEARAVEVARIMTAMHPADGEAIKLPALDCPDPERALTVMSWLRFLEKAKQPKPLQQAAVAIVRGADSAIVHRIYSPRRKPHRQTNVEIKTRTCGYILAGLKEAYGIVPGTGMTWVVAPTVSNSDGDKAGPSRVPNKARSAANLHSCVP